MNDTSFLDPAGAGVYFLSTRHWEAVQAAASRAGMRVLVGDLRAGDKEGVLQELGPFLQFPEWYGANLDALYDCLTELPPQSASGQVIFLSGLRRLLETAPESFSILSEVFRSATEARQAADQPLWIILDVPAKDLPELSIP